MERRVLLAVVLSFVVLYGYQVLFPPPPPTRAQGGSTSPAAGTAQSGGATAQPAPADQSAPPAVEKPQSQPVLAASAEQEVVVENEAVRAIFSNRGGVLKSWRLKHYSDPTGQPLDLVPQNVPGAVKPFTLDAGDAGANAALRDALFKPDATALDASHGQGTLTFEYGDASGLTARKHFTFTPDHPYLITFTADVTRGGTAVNPAVQWGPGIGTGIVGGGMSYNPPPQPIFYKDRKVHRIGIKDVPNQRAQEGVVLFGGVDDHYFLAAALPAQPIRLEFNPMIVPIEGVEQPLQFVDWTARFPAAPKDQQYFFGPKDYDVLHAISPDLTRAIDFGMFDWLVVPLLRALKWVHGYVGNYGWSIIVLTVLINLVMFPLRHKSVVSMRRMQELQPEVKAIQDRYAKLKMSDPARSKMNAELMNLYRERGVNPASGCVPMLLTFPVLLAFYSMLSVAIELRGAPFVGWIRDLSAHDPLFVTPVLMGITQFVQTKMTPSTADPVQQKMMLFMPIMFSVMLLWMPSGLVLYWTASNLWGIGQQVLTNRLIGPAPQPRPPAERRVKSAGMGKSPQAAKERK